MTFFFCNHIKNQTYIKRIATDFISKIIAWTVFIIIRIWYIFIFEILKHDKKKNAIRTIVALVGTQWYILYKSIIYIAADYNLRRENNWSTIVSELVSKFYYVMECLVYIIYIKWCISSFLEEFPSGMTCYCDMGKQRYI